MCIYIYTYAEIYAVSHAHTLRRHFAQKEKTKHIIVLNGSCVSLWAKSAPLLVSAVVTKRALCSGEPIPGPPWRIEWNSWRDCSCKISRSSLTSSNGWKRRKQQRRQREWVPVLQRQASLIQGFWVNPKVSKETRPNGQTGVLWCGPTCHW